MISTLAKIATVFLYNYNFTNKSFHITGGIIAAAVSLSLIAYILGVIGLWKIFEKAGKPGWSALIPIYNTWVLAEVAGKPGWWGLYPVLSLIPFVWFVGWIVTVIVGIIISLEVAKRFDKSSIFGFFGLFMFSIIGYLILGFDASTYHPDTAVRSDAAAKNMTPAQKPSPKAKASKPKGVSPRPPKLIQ